MSEYEHIVETKMKKEEAIRRARILFNNEKYWGAHEILESVWKNSLKDEKDLLNGLILIAAAFVHEEKDELDICISILKRAMQKLSKASGLYFDLNINRIKDTISQIINTGKVERFAI
jgi:predicted metal-dependent hydrolase